MKPKCIFYFLVISFCFLFTSCKLPKEEASGSGSNTTAPSGTGETGDTGEAGDDDGLGDSTTESTKSSEAKITEFSFKTSDNTMLPVDVSATISGLTITASVKYPYGFGKTLTPTFKLSSGASAKISSTSQTSGTTANDYSSSPTYLIAAEDGSTQSYRVTINYDLTIPIQDSGQTACYNASTSITCPSSGQSFFGQDGNYINVNQQSYTDNSDGTITDNVTGLVWQQGNSENDADAGTNTYSFVDAATYCSNLNLASKTDWRLPSKTELSWIVENQGTDPYINPNFTGTNAGYFWTSSTYGLDNTRGWYNSFANATAAYQLKTNAYYVRCARGGAMPSQSFTEQGDEVVTDNNTGLVWQQCSFGLSGANCGTGAAATKTWAAALTYCEDLTLGGETDWRLPNRNELESIVDESKVAAPTVDGAVFPATVSNYYWSSTTFGLGSVVWMVQFSGGNVSYGGKTGNTYVRCVR